MQDPAIDRFSDIELYSRFGLTACQRPVIFYTESEIDTNAQLPIQPSGIIPTIGKAHLKLRECQTQSQTN